MTSDETKTDDRRPRWITKTRELFGIDPRSLALFRTGLGLLLIGDLIVRATSLRAHYTDWGLLPRDALTQFFPPEASFSLHLLSGSAGAQAVLFIIAGVFAAMMVVGCHTRLATIASYVMALSLDNRNPMVVQSADVLLRVLLFWAMFLPLGMVWSVDARRRRGPWPSDLRPYLSLATAALLLQICFVYWFGYLLKAGPIWHEGKALYYALNCDLYVARAGIWLRGQPALLVPMTLAVLYTELIGPFVAFCPVFTGPVRTLVVTVFVLLHLGFGVFLSIGIFPYVSAIAWAVFLPGWFWERPGVRWLTAWLKEPAESVPVREDQAVSPRGRRKFIEQVGVSILILASFYFVLVWNMRQSNADPATPTPPTCVQTLGRWLPLGDAFIGAGKLAGIDQFWTMFAPSPPQDNGWFVTVGRLSNGKDVDLLRGGAPVSWEKPPLVSATLPDGRWQKYFENLSSGKFKPQFRFYCRYLCRQWNDSHAENEWVRTIQVYWMSETTLVDRVTEPERKSMWIHFCADKTPPGTHAVESPGDY